MPPFDGTHTILLPPTTHHQIILLHARQRMYSSPEWTKLTIPKQYIIYTYKHIYVSGIYRRQWRVTDIYILYRYFLGSNIFKGGAYVATGLVFAEKTPRNTLLRRYYRVYKNSMSLF